MDTIPVEISEETWASLIAQHKYDWHAKALGGSVVHTCLRGQRRLLRFVESGGRIRFFRYGSEDT